MECYLSTFSSSGFCCHPCAIPRATTTDVAGLIHHCMDFAEVFDERVVSREAFCLVFVTLRRTIVRFSRVGPGGDIYKEGPTTYKTKVRFEKQFNGGKLTGI